jgi:hypothetical protein
MINKARLRTMVSLGCYLHMMQDRVEYVLVVVPKLGCVESSNRTFHSPLIPSQVDGLMAIHGDGIDKTLCLVWI